MSSDSDHSIPSNSDSSPPEDRSLTIRQLRDELETVLKSDLKIAGNYYTAREYKFYSNSNNPCITVEDVGLIDLPLSTETAQKIVEFASKAPYGRGEQTIVDTQVRDTWQIEPTKVQFGNTRWDYEVRDYVRDICSDLGISNSYNVKCEFYKLLLYETGSHFLPHQDSEKAEGMFATMVIVLPSTYEGGQVHLQHGSRKDVIDVSSNCDGISALSWYTDVTHEIKPITSGYRLAFSYNLIHTSMESPIPHLIPEDAGMARLKAVLEKWNASDLSSAYQQENLLVYILDHEYSAANLEMGVKTLKGKDAATVACLRNVAEGLGFTILFGTLQYYLTGQGRYAPGLDSGSEDDEQKPYSFYNLYEKTLTIEKLVDTEGNPIKVIHDIEIEGDENYIPKTYFKEAEPYNEEHEPYCGNDGNNLQHWYHQSALLLFPEKDGYKILYKAGGANFALWRLNRVIGAPSDSDKKLAKHMLRYSTSWKLSPDARQTALQTMADRTLEWNDSSLWIDNIGAGKYIISIFGIDRLASGIKTFGFENVQECFEKIIVTKQSLQGRLDFIDSLSTHATQSDQESVRVWCSNQYLRIFQNLGPLQATDVPTLVKFAIEKGTTALLDIVFSQLNGSVLSPSFWIAFMRALVERKTAMLTHASTSNQDDLDEIARLCINMASDAWFTEFSSMMAQTSYGRRYEKKAYISPSDRDKTFGRITSILNFSAYAKQPEACSKLIEKFMEIENEPGRIEELLVPLAHRISSDLRSARLALTKPPYSVLLSTIVDNYFVNLPIIDQKLAKLRDVGCGCSDCISVDAFIQDVTLQCKDLELPYLRRAHVEMHLMKAEDLVYFHALQEDKANPHGLKIRKLPLTILTHEWQRRLADANDFLGRIGSVEELSNLLGSKYQEIQQNLVKIKNAIEGTADE